MNIVLIIFRPVITFLLIASFSFFFMYLFLLAGILSTKINRNVVEETDEMNNLKAYSVSAIGGLIGGTISLFVLVFL